MQLLRTPLLTRLAVLLWVVFVLVIYYIAHKPVTVRAAENFGGAVLDFGGAGLLVAVAGGLGRSILPRGVPGWGEIVGARADRRRSPAGAGFAEPAGAGGGPGEPFATQHGRCWWWCLWASPGAEGWDGWAQCGPGRAVGA
ncbi:MAG: hypothetical protein HC915_21420 [Anaerolineae bacterium]|nr:hypothetical protein [Anaerolineae bacterium]